MSDTLTDPVLGLLKRIPEPDANGERPWVGRAWLNPKHEIGLAFNPAYTDEEGMPARLLLARKTLEAIVREEWEFRLATAGDVADLSEVVRAEGEDDPDPAALARLLRPVRIELFGDGSANVIYHGPPALAGREVCGGVNPDGTFDGVDVFTLESGGPP